MCECWGDVTVFIVCLLVEFPCVWEFSAVLGILLRECTVAGDSGRQLRYWIFSAGCDVLWG